jgi:chaperonin GroES
MYYKGEHMNFKPLQDKILVKRTETEKVTQGGILVPDTAVEKPNQGVVLSVGPGKYLANGTFQPTTLKVDDKILFTKGAGALVTLDNEEYVVLKEDDVYAVIGTVS